MLRLLRPPKRIRVLEIGCGRGVALPVLAESLAPTELVGLDLDPTLVSVAQERIRTGGIQARVVEGDVRALPFDDHRFDLVIDFGTCYHVSGGAMGSCTALREVMRVLPPGGLFIHETPIAQHLAHPVRSFGRMLPWSMAPELRPYRRALLWSMRRKVEAGTPTRGAGNT